MIAIHVFKKFIHTILAAQLVLFAACGDDGGDSQSTPGSIGGDISSTVACPRSGTSDDCMGTLYVGLFVSSDLSSASVASAVLPDVDLSTGASVAYTIPTVDPGTYYLAAFLDDNDNGNADAAQALPDPGDLVANTGTKRVTIEAGQTAQGDMLFDLRLPGDTTDPCESVLCSGHGTCQDAGGSPECACETGYTAQGLECVADDPCESVLCSGHGTCQDAGGSPECACETGYTAQGLECVADAPLPPSDLSCPTPACAGDALCEEWLDRDWYYVSNNMDCSGTGSLLFHFGADGTFWFRHQYDDSGSSKNFEYGCWALTSSDTPRLTIAYDYESENTFNCLSPAGWMDPPCTGVLEQLDADSWFQADSWDSYSERHVFRALPLPECAWCSDGAACCPEPGFVETSDGPICQ